MGTAIKITGEVDRRDPDPSAPHDQNRAWLGNLRAEFSLDGLRVAHAAIVAVATGGGVTSREWGPHALVLRWIGDEPTPEVAQAVYDAVRDRGPKRGEVNLTVEATQAGADQQSYRRIRRAS